MDAACVSDEEHIWGVWGGGDHLWGVWGGGENCVLYLYIPSIYMALWLYINHTNDALSIPHADSKIEPVNHDDSFMV